ncbi:MAG: alpha/beta hydrolase [Nitrososphaeraceae archaeon]|nr:alpha/beta hydrolase [Nitrososphaeraceae archaeon]
MSIKIKGDNGVRINVEDIGSKNGKPVVFIHGWPVNHNMFEYQFTELPKHGYRCVGIDLRGFGESDKPWDSYNYDTMADDVKAVLDTLNLQDATLVGFSMGGSISIHYISRHQGAHIKKLALLGAAAPCFTKREDFPYGIDKSAVDDLIRQTYEDRPSMLRNFSEIFFANPEKLSPEFKIWNLSLGLAASSYATIQCAIELRDADLRKDLASIQVSTLILHGVNDRVCLFDLAKVMHEGIKDSRLVQIEKAGHGFYFEERKRVNSELVKFIG